MNFFLYLSFEFVFLMVIKGFFYITERFSSFDIKKG
jgi:hypothetical protein